MLCAKPFHRLCWPPSWQTEVGLQGFSGHRDYRRQHRSLQNAALFSSGAGTSLELHPGSTKFRPSQRQKRSRSVIFISCIKHPLTHTSATHLAAKHLLKPKPWIMRAKRKQPFLNRLDGSSPGQVPPSTCAQTTLNPKPKTPNLKSTNNSDPLSLFLSLSLWRTQNLTLLPKP